MPPQPNLQTVKQRFGIVGDSPLLNAALDTAIRVAPTKLSVLITGESGVGKEAFSKIIHSLSPRKHGPFIAVNTGAIPEGTINSELFGHERGSFTSSVSERKGYFETVNNGTIFLDEIGEMPLDTQAFLLRILENGEFMRLGSSKVLHTDVRVIAATNVLLEEKIRNNKFREDLYYRLNQVQIRVPSLRERIEDLPLLILHFALEFATRNRVRPIQLTEEAMHLLTRYHWPGNIRELKNTTEQLAVLSDNYVVTEHDIIRLLPHIGNRNLLSTTLKNAHPHDFNERELLYKLLFDMKNDLNDLKSLVYELISSNNLQVNGASFQHTGPFTALPASIQTITQPVTAKYPVTAAQPYVIQAKRPTDDEVSENLSLEQMEKELIRKALKKFNGRRKEAAEELGFSERTLYRKIKQYDLVE